jgi:hypothetical protein
MARPTLSPEFDLRVFCYQMMDKDPAQVLHAASAEISYTRQNHRDQTSERNFREGTKGRRYCDDLQQLIRIVMNGQMPPDPNPDFVQAIAPLIKNLLKKWTIGTLRQHFTD